MKPQNHETEENSRNARRLFLKSIPAGAALGASVMAQLPGKALSALSETNETPPAPLEGNHGPFEIEESYMPFDQRNVIQGGGPATRKPDLKKQMMQYAFALPDPKKSGYSQLEYALKKGASSFKFKNLKEGLNLEQSHLDISHLPVPPPVKRAFTSGDDLKSRKPSHILDVLEGDYVFPKKFRFEDKAQAAGAVKRAGCLYGADLVGIARRDPRFDYDPLWDPVDMKTWSWKDFPFEPKTVIVLGFEMDYEAMSAAPSFLCDAATGEGYSRIHKTIHQMAVFLKNLGYQAVGAENDLGLSIPYAELAGLGEHARNGMLITHEFGPRIRLAKIYTELDFVAYDRPVRFGVIEFCRSCKRCADQCPTKAITFEDDPTFEPSFNVEGNWFVNTGIRKYYNNTMLCWKWWAENGESCGSCISACPYNKPDFWHHRLVHELTAMMPGPVHDFMREMDKVFGYGNTFDPEAARKFWSGN